MTLIFFFFKESFHARFIKGVHIKVQNADVSLWRFICEDNKSFSSFHFQPVTDKTDASLW